MAEETRKIVRLMRKDLPGEVSIEAALRSLRGVGFMTGRAIRIKAGFDVNTKMGDLTEEEIGTIEKIIEAPHSFNLPAWLLNRRKDPETGIDTHKVETNLMLAHREDLVSMKKIRSYRGVRHMFNLKTRGQRTRSTGRKNRTVGVQRKKKVGA